MALHCEDSEKHVNTLCVQIETFLFDEEEMNIKPRSVKRSDTLTFTRSFFTYCCDTSDTKSDTAALASPTEI